MGNMLARLTVYLRRGNRTKEITHTHKKKVQTLNVHHMPFEVIQNCSVALVGMQGHCLG